MSNYSELERERYSIFERFYTCELEWADLRVMDENEFTRLQYDLAGLKGQIALLKVRQPNCKELLERYDREFAKYSTEVESILQVNNHERHQLKGYLFSKEKIESLRKTIDDLQEVRNDNWNLLDERTIEYSTRVWWKLISLKYDVETDSSQFFDSLEKMAKTLEINHSTLIALLRPTHEWVSESPKRKRCAKCSKELVEKTERRYASYEERQEKPKPVRDPDGYLPTI